MTVPSIETKIFQAIKARVETLPMRTTHDIVWTTGDNTLETGAGSSYTPNPTKSYLRCTWTPNRASREGRVSSTLPVRRMGVLQIDVMAVKTQGSGVAREVAGQVAAHFPLDLSMPFMGVGVRVMEPPSVLAAFIDTHIQLPVIIQTDCYA